jgi:hypothetical protein
VVAGPPIDGTPHLLVVPVAEALGTDEHGAGGAFVQGSFDGRLPQLTGDEVPLVQPRLQILPDQTPS